MHISARVAGGPALGSDLIHIISDHFVVAGIELDARPADPVAGIRENSVDLVVCDDGKLRLGIYAVHSDAQRIADDFKPVDDHVIAVVSPDRPGPPLHKHCTPRGLGLIGNIGGASTGGSGLKGPVVRSRLDQNGVTRHGQSGRASDRGAWIGQRTRIIVIACC